MVEQFTVLFVEDDNDVRVSVQQILESKGFRLLVARDGDEALRLLAKNEVDALFTDVVMPGMDGISLAKQAKRLKPELKVMFMTGYYSRGAEAGQLGTLLFKPIRAAPLVEALRGLLGVAQDGGTSDPVAC